MLTRLRVRNFKRFEQLDIELGSPVVFFGPNNSGKTTAMQALALWDLGLKRWHDKKAGRSRSAQRSGVPINRRDLLVLPHPTATQFWRGKRVREGRARIDKVVTENIRIELIVNGISLKGSWECGLEFDYANEDQIYCRPLRLDDSKPPHRMAVPPESVRYNLAYLPPMSGLAEREPLYSQGSIDVLLGQGRTAEVLRNLCYSIYESHEEAWDELAKDMTDSFGVDLMPPTFAVHRGEITLGYKEGGVEFDISAAGRGLHQTLLIMAFLFAYRGAALMIEEPDAHLDSVRQRAIYQLLADSAKKTGGQLIVASQSEALLSEASQRADRIVDFVGRSQLRNTDMVEALART